MHGTAIKTRIDARDQPAAESELSSQIDALKERLRIGVIFGGSKGVPGSVLYEARNSRSWKSYEAVAHDIGSALRRIGFRHVQLMPDDMNLGDRLRREQVHMAWLNTGGIQGLNPAGHAPAMLEMMGVPYVGHDPLAATTLDNKHAFKREAVCAGLPTAPFATWHMARGPFRPEMNSRFRLAFGDYAGPFIVKPVSGRASLHVHVVEKRAELAAAIAEVYGKTNDVVLIEKYLSGREFCIAAAGPLVARGGRLFRGAGPFTFGALERVLEAEEKIFTSMDVRPITGERCRPLRSTEDAALASALHELARSVFLEFNLGSIIRLDVRADEAGKLYILEANPKPDLKQPGAGVTSLVCEGLSEFGMSYDDLILSLLADRLDYLFWHRPEAARHILELCRGAGPARPACERTPATSQNSRLELGIRDLQAAIDAVRNARQRKGFIAALSEVTELQSCLEASPRSSWLRPPTAAAPERSREAHGVES